MIWSAIGCLDSFQLSDTTLKIQYNGDKEVNGLIVDWDNVASKDDEVIVALSPCSPQTTPFSSIAFLHGRCRNRLYRHDLESFVYILIWAAVHYDLRTQSRAERVHELLAKWVDGSWLDRGDAKEMLINSTYGRIRKSIRKAFGGDFKSTMNRTVMPLLELLALEYNLSADDENNSSGSEEDYDPSGGAFTFEGFMQRIGYCSLSPGHIPNLILN